MFLYSSISEMIIGFGFWLNEEVKKNGIRKIIFFSREGWFFGKILESSGFKFLVPTEYAMTSRRVARLAMTPSFSNMLSIIDAPSADNDIKFFLQTRFNFSNAEIDDIDFNSYGIESSETIVNRKSDREKIVNLMSDYFYLYKNKSLEMRAKAEIYYKNFFAYENRIMIVDIGYNGTSQKFINDLFPCTLLFGRYFATFCGAKEIGGGFSKGWMFNNFNNKKSKNWFTRNVPFFEFLFMTEEGTLLDFDISKDKEIVCLTSINENLAENKYIFSKISEETSLKLSRIVIRNNSLLKLKSKILFSFLMKFRRKKIKELFHGIVIDDAYGGLNKRNIL